MKRKMLKLLGIAAMALAALGTGMAFLSSQVPEAQAAATAPAPGTICTRLASMYHIFNPWGLPSGPVANTAGTIAAQVGQPISTADGRSGFTFTVVGFNSSGSVQGLGNVNMTLDPSRRASTSTFISNSPSTATAKALAEGNTQRINLYINVDIDGRRYRSQGEVTLLSTAVQAFPPPPGTVYELTANVTLLDENGRPAFVLPAGYAARIEG
jgi:hypothetical protein